MKTYTVSASTADFSKVISHANFDNLDRACEYASEQIAHLYTAEEFKTPTQEHGAIIYQNTEIDRNIAIRTTENE